MQRIFKQVNHNRAKPKTLNRVGTILTSKKMAKTKYISTRLNDEQRESIEKYCETYGRTISHFIREAIDEKIEHFNRFENLLKPKK
jgi:hypothetical protein